MSKIALTPNASGDGVFTITAPNSGTNRAIALPDAAGAVLLDSSNLAAAKITGTVATSQIADANVTTAKIADANVTTAKITDANVTTAKIADANVTQGKLADQAVNEAKMQVSNAPTNGYFLSAQSGNTGGLTWAEVGGGLTLATSVNTTSGTQINFTGIPAGVNRITVMFSLVRLDSSNPILVQIGDSGGIEDSGYASSSSDHNGGGASTSSFTIFRDGGNDKLSGQMFLTRITGNQWVSGHSMSKDTNGETATGGGTKTLSGELTQLRITSGGAGGTLNNGNASISWE